MKTIINGIEYGPETTVAELVDMLKEKGEFEKTAEGFKTNITTFNKTTPVQDFLNETSLEPSSPIFFRNAKAIRLKGGELRWIGLALTKK